MVPRATRPQGRPTNRPGTRTLPAMPAPLGNRPTKKMPEIQVFGRDDSPETRAALRFFRERRVVVHYVDLKKRPHRGGRAQALHGTPGTGRAAGYDLAGVPRRGSRLSQPGRRRDRRPTAGGRAAHPPPARASRQRGHGRAGRRDVGALGQAVGRFLTAVHATTMPAIARIAPMTAHLVSPIHEAVRGADPAPGRSRRRR